MREDRRRLLFADKLIKAIKADHNYRKERGQEKKAFSASAYQADIQKKYPRVETSILFTTIGRYLNDIQDNPQATRDINEEKIDGILRYVFELKGDKAWPATKRVVKDSGRPEYIKYVEANGNDNELPEPPSPGMRLLMLAVEELKREARDNNKGVKSLEQDLEEERQTNQNLRSVLAGLIQKMESEPITPEREAMIKRWKSLLG